MAIKSAITIWRGEDVTLPFDIDEDITGWTFNFFVSDTLADSTPTLTVAGVITTPATGLLTVTLTKAQTLTLNLATYYWELVRTNVGTETVLAYGALTVLPRVGT